LSCFQDFADRGQRISIVGAAQPTHFRVSPSSHAFETLSGNRSVCTFLMNHEMVHVAAGDMASEEDQRLAPLLYGKVYRNGRTPNR
jgi:hypothetical protein